MAINIVMTMTAAEIIVVVIIVKWTFCRPATVSDVTMPCSATVAVRIVAAETAVTTPNLYHRISFIHNDWRNLAGNELSGVSG